MIDWLQAVLTRERKHVLQCINATVQFDTKSKFLFQFL